MEQEKKPERFTIPLPEDTPTPPPVQETPKKSKGMTPSGFAENALNDAFDFLKGLYQIIPSSVKSYQENIPKIFDQKGLEILKKDPSLLWKAVKETGGGIGKSMIEPYTEHGARVLYERPLTVATDLASILTLGGGAVTKAGKLAGGTVKGVGKASELVRAGMALEELPGKLARGIVDKSVMKVSGGNWDLAKRREALFMKGNEQARRLYMSEKDVENFGRGAVALSDQEAALLHKYIRQGVMPDELAKTPKVEKAFLGMKTVNDEVWRPGLVERRFKTASALDEALAKKYALEVFDDVSEASMVKARAEIKALREAGGHGPIYAPHIPEGKLKKMTAEDLMDDFASGGKLKRVGAAGLLEEFSGKAASYVKDPRKYIPKAIFAFRELEAKARFSERLLQSKHLITGSGPGMTSDAFLKGTPDGISRKYWEDSIRAQALKKITDPTIQRLLRWEYIHTQHGALRLYDQIMRLFAKSATRWNPKWQTGNVIGDAVLGTLAGSNWSGGKAARLADNLPYEAVAKGGAGALEGVEQMSKAPKFVDRAFEIGEEADKAARAGIIVKETARQLERVGLKLEAFSETVPHILGSTREFSDVQVALQLLEENIARRDIGVQRIDKVLTTLEKREADLSRKLEGLDLRHRVKAKEKFEKADERLTTHPDGPDSDRGYVKAKTAEEAIPLGATGSAAFEKGLQEINNLRQRIVSLNAKKTAIVKDIADDMVKKGALDARIPDLKEQVAIVRTAIERQNAVIGDYLALDGFEQNVLKRIIPFYSWTKAMTMLSFRVPYLAPVKAMLWHRMSQFMMKQTEDPEMPQYTRGRVPIFALKDGRQVWVNIASYSPFGGLSQSKFADIPIPQMFNVVERNPMIALGFRYMGGKTIWDATSVPYGEQMVNMHDGTVVEFTKDGMLKKVIPQTPLVQGAAHFFPTVQLAEQILTPFWTNKYNWAGVPEPIYNPDGVTYKYPKEMLDRLSAAVGVNMMTRSADDLKRGERRKVFKAITELKTMHDRSSDREEREMLKDVMRDYISENKYRKFKAS